MASEIITLEDLEVFRSQLINDIKVLLSEHTGQPVKRWLKSREVRQLLNISPGTLQTLRDNGTLPFTRIGGVIYYDYADIQAMIESHKYQSNYQFTDQEA